MADTEEKLLALLNGRRGHFQMESGYHSELWFDLDALFEQPDRLRPYVAKLARRLAGHGAAAVCGPMTGGAKLAQIIAGELGVESFFAERFAPPGASGLFPVKYVLPLAQREHVRGKAVAIVDDAISAGSAVRGTYADLLACGARPVAIGALIVLGDTAVQFATNHKLQLESIARMSFGLWKPADCPLCRADIAVERVADAV